MVVVVVGIAVSVADVIPDSVALDDIAKRKIYVIHCGYHEYSYTDDFRFLHEADSFGFQRKGHGNQSLECYVERVAVHRSAEHGGSIHGEILLQN